MGGAIATLLVFWPSHAKRSQGIPPLTPSAFLDFYSKWDYNSPMKNLTDLHIRLPKPIYEQIWRLAQEHERSLNGEVVVALKAYLDAIKKKTEEYAKTA